MQLIISLKIMENIPDFIAYVLSGAVMMLVMTMCFREALFIVIGIHNIAAPYRLLISLKYLYLLFVYLFIYQYWYWFIPDCIFIG